MRRAALSVVVALLIAAPPAGAAGAGAPAFAGRCQFSGTIRPMPPITVVPKPGAHFSYLGDGTCTGRLADRPVTSAPLSVSFDDVHTLFDTCELGPDVGLHGLAWISAGRDRARFAIVIHLARVAIAGPFALTTIHSGRALGVASFMPADPVGAARACGAAGVASATLTGSFRTVTPLVGVSDPSDRARAAPAAARRVADDRPLSAPVSRGRAGTRPGRSRRRRGRSSGPSLGCACTA
jgi:hypothetical protein